MSRRVLGATTLVAAFALLRIPSLFEPAYALDEGFYADIGRALDHGAVMYRDVWDFKPPGLYFLSAALSLGHASVFRMQLALSVAVAMGTALTWMVGRRLSTGTGAFVAALLFLVLASLPSLSGDQLNAEIIAALPAAAAMLLMVSRANVARWWVPACAGVLAAVACVVKTQALADLLAITLVPLIGAVAAHSRPGRSELRAIALVVAGWLATLALISIPLALGGSLQGLIDSLSGAGTAYAKFYQGGLLSTTAPSGGEMMALARVSGALLLGAVATLGLARRRHRAAAVSAWWLACVLAAIMVDTRGLSHYLQQADVPLSLTGALLFVRLTAGFGVRRAAGGAAALIFVWLTTVVAIYVPLLTGSLISGEGVPKLPSWGVSMNARYYELGWRHVFGLVSVQRYEASFKDVAYPLNESVAALLDVHSRPSEPVYVWGGSTPWTYALADRSASSEFLWMNSGYAHYPDAQAVTVRQLEEHPPAVMVVEAPLPGSVIAMLRSRGYQLVTGAAPGVDYWLAPWAIR